MVGGLNAYLPRVRDFGGPATLPQDFHQAQHRALAGMMIKAGFFMGMAILVNETPNV
ncbi:hypothetical protein ACCAA_1080001 [Candidatus Accumulibacter aalborgensis]|uniref:Uncharacterized protein n=1 Tax=Candidatus Accumulibacter aalborgensis TaxID=1860102 RepID=A0A1A8XEI2_9PROT|nr:hypothetical protein ACCAA_1080001 [Candidatus Accumulibacter aalborgensis]